MYIVFSKKLKKRIYYDILSIYLNNFASFFSTLAYKYIPGSIAFTIVQLNAVWTVLVGILIFKEIDFKKN